MPKTRNRVAWVVGFILWRPIASCTYNMGRRTPTMRDPIRWCSVPPIKARAEAQTPPPRGQELARIPLRIPHISGSLTSQDAGWGKRASKLNILAAQAKPLHNTRLFPPHAPLQSCWDNTVLLVGKPHGHIAGGPWTQTRSGSYGVGNRGIHKIVLRILLSLQ